MTDMASEVDGHPAALSGGVVHYSDFSWASFSRDMRHRFMLGRAIDGSESPHVRRVVFIMLNPSTADASKNDPTITRCMKFAAAWGMTGMIVVNLYSFRTPHPAELWNQPRAERGGGQENNDEIIRAVAHATKVVAAWGNGGGVDGRAAEVHRMLAGVSNTWASRNLECLGYEIGRAHV